MILIAALVCLLALAPQLRHGGAAQGPTAALGAAEAGAPYDILIKNGHILDGAGNPWSAGDVGVRGDRIVAMGKLEGSKRQARD